MKTQNDEAIEHFEPRVGTTKRPWLQCSAHGYAEMSAPSLAWRHRLHDSKPEPEQFATDARCSQSEFSMLIRRDLTRAAPHGSAVVNANSNGSLPAPDMAGEPPPTKN